MFALGADEGVTVADQFLTLSAAAEALDVSRFKVSRLIRDGELQAFVSPLDRRQRLVRRGELEALKRRLIPHEVEIDPFLNELAESLFGRVPEGTPKYYGPPRWHRFDLDGQAVDALRHVAALLPQAVDEPYLWKWTVIAMFDALHGFFGLALRGSDGAQLLTDKHEIRTYRRWNEERRRGKAITQREPDRVDETRSLYLKTLDPERMDYLGASPFTPTANEDAAFEHLAHLRDKLTHHGHGSRSIFVGELPVVILECLAIIEWLFEKSGTIRPRREERDQTREMIHLVRQEAETVARVYELEGYSE